ncbi:MAG: hypothetical protein MZV63_06015 [Marinilabiliales bacterium]|nr:hypothetical protein [Marinilabiliales bacterium]
MRLGRGRGGRHRARGRARRADPRQGRADPRRLPRRPLRAATSRCRCRASLVLRADLRRGRGRQRRSPAELYALLSALAERADPAGHRRHRLGQPARRGAGRSAASTRRSRASSTSAAARGLDRRAGRAHPRAPTSQHLMLEPEVVEAVRQRPVPHLGGRPRRSGDRDPHRACPPGRRRGRLAGSRGRSTTGVDRRLRELGEVLRRHEDARRERPTAGHRRSSVGCPARRLPVLRSRRRRTVDR